MTPADPSAAAVAASRRPAGAIRRCLLWLAWVLVAALGIPAVAHATTFGANVDGNFLNQVRGVWSSTQVMASLDALHAAGGRVGRAHSDWAGTEPRRPVHGRHTYDWAYDDLVVGEMAQAHLRWQPVLAFAPKWAEVHRSRIVHTAGGRFVAYLPPASNATFAAYATAFMRRYGSHGAFWKSHRTLPDLPVITVEVWNEPDNKHDWGADINLGDYARMYEAVRTAIRRVDRHTKVVTGGLAWTPSSLPRLLKAFRGRSIDAVAFHPYAATPAGTVAIARSAIAQMRKFGRGRTPLLANEYGWTSGTDTWATTEVLKVHNYVYQALIGLAKLRLADVLPFEWTDLSWGLSDGAYAQALHDIATAAGTRSTAAKAGRRA